MGRNGVSNILTGSKQTIFFWRARGGREVDVVVKGGEAIHAYEMKWQKQLIHGGQFEKRYTVTISGIHTSDPFLRSLRIANFCPVRSGFWSPIKNLALLA